MCRIKSMFKKEISMFAVLTILICTLASASAGRLRIEGNRFLFDDQHVFLAGANFPWVSFYLGTNNWDATAIQTYETEVSVLAAAGANSIRVWVHGDVASTPAFDSSGYVTGLSSLGDAIFLSQFTHILDVAQQNNMLVFPTLFNAVPADEINLDEMILDPDKLTSYIHNALTPFVNAVKDHPALGGWDIITDPEAKLIPNQEHEDPCQDTTPLWRVGPGWVSRTYTALQLQRFINRMSAAIKAADPTALTTIGAWDSKSSIDTHGYHNYYKDECLVNAGGNPQGTLDFYEFHCFAGPFGFDRTAIFHNSYADYNPDKPVVVGEFSQQASVGLSDSWMFQYIYNNDFHGAWVFVHTLDAEENSPITSIVNLTSNGVIPIDLSV